MLTPAACSACATGQQLLKEGLVSRITSIIFDLDGTIYCSSELAAEIHRVAVDGLALQLGITAPEADAKLIAAK